MGSEHFGHGMRIQQMGGGEAPFTSGSRHGMSPISCDKGLIANLNDEKRGLFSVTWSQWFLPGMVRKPLRIDS